MGNPEDDSRGYKIVIFSPAVSWVLILGFILFFILYSTFVFSHLSAQRCLDQGMRLLENSRALSADLLVERIVLYQRALGLLKDSMRLNGRDSRAYFEYAEAVALAAQDPSIREMIELKTLSGTYVSGELGLYESARQGYIEAISKEPLNALYHQRLGRIYARLSDTQKAESEFNKAVMLSPGNLSIHLYLAQYYLSSNNNEGFLLHIRKAIELQGHDSGGQVGGQTMEFLRSIGREDLVNQ